MVVHLSFIAVIASAFPQQERDSPLVPAAALTSAMLGEWRAMSARVRTMRVQFTEERIAGLRGASPRLTDRTVVTAVNCPLGRLQQTIEESFDDQNNLKRKSESLHIENTKYSADLGKRKDSDAWLLVKYSEQPLASDPLFERLALPWLLYPRATNTFFPDWIADDCFVINSIEPAADGITRINFFHDESRRRKLDKDAATTIRSGYFDVVPSHKYRIAGYRFEIKTKYSEGAETGTMEYASDQDDLPVLQRWISESPNMKSTIYGSGSFRYVESFSIDYNRDMAEDQFRLSYYGLPEPVGVAWQKPTPTYIWILAGAGMCAILAVGFRYIARRKFRATT
jgi:hypothetical protein